MKREFNLSYVYYFLSVAEMGSISRAAEWLHITQPTLSSAISTLEKELEVQLFDRIGKNRIVLNRFGQCFYERARDAFQTLDQAVDEIRDLQDSTSGSVRFSLPSPAMFAPTISRFIALHPTVSVQQSSTDLHFTRQQLLDGELDFAVSFFPHPGAEFIWLPFLRTRLDLILSVDHALANAESPALSALDGTPLVLCTDNNLFPDLCRDLLGRVGVSPRFQYIGPRPEEAAHYILHSGAAALSCGAFSQTLSDSFQGVSSVKTIPVDRESGGCEMGFVIRKKHYLTCAVKELIAMLAAENGNVDDFALRDS